MMIINSDSLVTDISEDYKRQFINASTLRKSTLAKFLAYYNYHTIAIPSYTDVDWNSLFKSLKPQSLIGAGLQIKKYLIKEEGIIPDIAYENYKPNFHNIGRQYDVLFSLDGEKQYLFHPYHNMFIPFSLQCRDKVHKR